MGLSIWQIAVVAILVILLFGRGKLSGLMTDLADGIKSFRRGIRDEPDPAAEPSAIASEIPAADVADTGAPVGKHAE